MQCHWCGTQLPAGAEFSREVFHCPGCGRMVSSQIPGSAISPDERTVRSFSGTPMQPLPPTGYGSSSNEERNPYTYNPYEQAAYGVDVPPQSPPPYQNALPERGFSQFIKTHMKLIILISVLLFWISLPDLATKSGDTPNSFIDNLCVILLLIFWPTSLALGLYQTARLKRWGWFVCILLLSPIISVGSFIYVLVGPTTFRQYPKPS